MIDALEMNVAARVMLLSTSLGIGDARRVSIYQRAVFDAMRHRLCGSDTFEDAVELILAQELDMLKASVLARRARVDAGSTQPVNGASKKTEKAPSGYVPEVKPLEEKLKEARKPVQKLITEDCVAMGLVDPDLADRLVLGMTGKYSRDAELEVVDQLRTKLHKQVRAFLRRAKDCPLANPRAQEELREDIARVTSVGGLLMLCRQINREQARWDKAHPRGGLRGLLGSLRR